MATATNSDAPDAFLCPITHMVMQDPVQDLEGNTYERSAIMEWLSRNSTSPSTRSPLDASQLVSNRALRELIEQWNKGTSMTRQSHDVKAAIAEPMAGLHMAVPPTPANTCTMRITSLPSGKAVVSIVPPAVGGRVPVDICCVVDTSGSMSVQATLKSTTGGAEESDGLSVLDIAKHSVRTIAQSLGPRDRLAIIGYSTKARVVMALTNMTKAGRLGAVAAVMAMHAGGQTNIWDGLQAGLDALGASQTGNFQSVMLLTDGLPNISPTRGEAAMLKRRRASNVREQEIVVNTFGFGYSLNTRMLRAIASEGMGSFAFIPDASLVGTVFVNALSNTLVTVGTKAQLTLEPVNGARFSAANAFLRTHRPGRDAGEDCVVDVGTLQLGQTKDVLVEMELAGEGPYLKATLTYTHTLPRQQVAAVACDAAAGAANLGVVEYHVCRAVVVNAILEAMVQMPNIAAANAIVDKAIVFVKGSPGFANAAARELVEDLTGQVKEALSRKDWYDKWGKHYLPSLAMAHFNQQCNNFKDPGVQVYGGEDFARERDLADAIFCKLPPPRAARQPRSQTAFAGAAPPAPSRAARPAVDMSRYMNRGGGCFHGRCQVSMADGSRKSLCDVQRGDVVVSSPGRSSTVRCVVVARKPSGKAELVCLPNTELLATPWHPVRGACTDQEWAFPASMAAPRPVACDAVYNLLLENGVSVVIEGMECVTLGHELTGEVVAHAYFGTQAVVRDLQRMPGWSAGRVVLAPDIELVRDDTSGRVVAMRQQTN